MNEEQKHQLTAVELDAVVGGSVTVVTNSYKGKLTDEEITNAVKYVKTSK